jgi:cytochrome P450/NADPH-cytochrome P450 reductase
VSGTYLQRLNPGNRIQIGVRSTNKLFRPPNDLEKTPMIMFCAGWRLAPLRSFVPELAVLIAKRKRKLNPALLLIGCRALDNDQLYADEFDE